MGWTWYHATEYTKSGRVSPSREIRKDARRHLFDYQEILDEAFVNRVYYAAIKDNRTDEVWALVCLTGTSTADYYNFGYKDMDEFMGPYNYDCPDRIIDLLTPTDNEWANRWREKCRERNRKSKAPNSFKNLPDGAIVEYTFTFDSKYHKRGDTVRLQKGKQHVWVKRSPYVWHIVGENLYMKPSMVKEYKVIE